MIAKKKLKFIPQWALGQSLTAFLYCPAPTGAQSPQYPVFIVWNLAKIFQKSETMAIKTAKLLEFMLKQG